MKNAGYTVILDGASMLPKFFNKPKFGQPEKVRNIKQKA
jgi:hypothetical protein